MTEPEIGLAQLLDEVLPRGEAVGEWQRVLRDAGRHPRSRHRKLAVVFVVAAFAALIPLTALAVSNDWWFLGSASLAPPPVGEVIVVREGNSNGVPWALTVYRSAAQGLCVGFTPNPPDNQATLPARGHGAGLSCGAQVRGITGVAPDRAGVFSFFGSFARPQAGASAFPDFLAGTTAVEVAQVRLVRAGGPPITVDTFPAPDELGMAIRFFVALVPGGGVHELVAVDGSGNALDHAVLAAPPNGGYDITWGS
jgi:hypothetical protein